MTFSVDKDTKICGSFAEVAGNRGCTVHNAAFQHLRLNYIYKSFSVSNVGKAIESMKVLNFRGAAITMPYKTDVIQYLDSLDPEAERIGAVNTILNDNGKLTGYNTDYFAIHELCSRMPKDKKVYILGKGGMGRTAHQLFEDLKFQHLEFITRNDWPKISKIKKSIVVNCTPAMVSLHSSNEFIDCSVNSETGKEISLLQASRQFELYTGNLFPMEYMRGFLSPERHIAH